MPLSVLVALTQATPPFLLALEPGDLSDADSGLEAADEESDEPDWRLVGLLPMVSLLGVDLAEERLEAGDTEQVEVGATEDVADAVDEEEQRCEIHFKLLKR